MTYSPRIGYSIFAILLLVFSGCGKIEIPEEIPTTTPESTTETIEEPSSETQKIEETQETPEVSTIDTEKNNLSEAIQVAQEELRTCQVELEKSKSIIQSNQSSQRISAEKTAMFIKAYINSVEQKEYPFSICGGLGQVTASSWYPQFVEKLNETAIPFSSLNRSLKTTDFYRVCASNSNDGGNIAVFLGARADGKSEFHLLQYNIANNSIEEAFLIEETCEACPNAFGKRNGPYISLSGQVGRTTAQYHYYYDKNILLTTEKCVGNSCEYFEE